MLAKSFHAVGLEACCALLRHRVEQTVNNFGLAPQQLAQQLGHKAMPPSEQCRHSKIPPKQRFQRETFCALRLDFWLKSIDISIYTLNSSTTSMLSMLPSKDGLLHLCGAFEPLFCQDVAVLLRSWNTRSPPGDDPTSTAARRRVVRPKAAGKSRRCG